MSLGELLFQNNDLRKISGASIAYYEGIEKNQINKFPLKYLIQKFFDEINNCKL